MNQGEDKRRKTLRLPRAKGSARRFTEYTPLTTPRERILAEYANAEFKDGGVRRPKPTPLKPGVDRSKYCQYHQSYGHITEDLIHLKDAIETLIKAWRLR